jgi:hypothetical protein
MLREGGYISLMTSHAKKKFQISGASVSERDVLFLAWKGLTN